MALSTYSDIVASVAAWTKRTDLAALVPDFIAVAEVKFNQRLRNKAQELAVAPTAIDSTLFTVAIPANTIQVKQLWRTDNDTPLKVTSYDVVVKRQIAGANASMYTVAGSNWVFDGIGTIQGIVWQTIPALTDLNPTNWLLASHPDAYLAGVMAEAAFYVKDETRAAMWTSRCNAIIDELDNSDMENRFGGPLIVRPVV